MSFDPKIGPKAPLLNSFSAPVVASESVVPSVKAQGYSPSSSFDTRAEKSAEGRGVMDDTIGVMDDTIGVMDDTIGVMDDTIGVMDDTIGRGVMDDTIGHGVMGDVFGPVGKPSEDYRARAGDTLWAIARTLVEQQGNAATRTAVANMLQDLKHANPHLTTAARKGGDSIFKDDPINFPKSFVPFDVNGLFERVRGTSVGPDKDPTRLAFRDEIFAKIESPLWSASGAEAQLRIESALSPLDAATRAQLSVVMAKLDVEGLKLLGAATQHSPKIFAERDSTGSTLLANLALMASQPLNTSMTANSTTAELLTSTLRDIVNPCRIAQGDAPTCTVTSMQFELVTDDPAEYVRLLAGLAGPGARAVMRGGGELKEGPNDAEAKARDGRNVSQAIFQSACMQFAKASAPDQPNVVRRGLTPAQQTTMLRNLFGVKYEAEILYDEAQGARALETLRGFDSKKNRNRPVIIELDQGPINHAVTLERVANGRVDFRDPYGVLRSISEAQFSKLVVAIHRPQ